MQGHRDAVLSIDVRRDGMALASSGADCCVKLWNLDRQALKSRVASATAEKEESHCSQPSPPLHAPLPVIEHFPGATVHTIHCSDDRHDWIDCVRWVGEFLLSRDVTGCAKLWQPPSLKADDSGEEHDREEVLNTFNTRDADYWYLRFQMDASCRWLATGNARGEISLWDVDHCPARRRCTLNLPHKRRTMVRMTAFNHNARFLACCCDDSTVCVWKLDDISQASNTACQHGGSKLKRPARKFDRSVESLIGVHAHHTRNMSSADVILQPTATLPTPLTRADLNLLRYA